MCGLKRLTAEELAIDIEREPAQAKRTLEALVEAGLAQTHGISMAAPTRLQPAFIRLKEQCCFHAADGF